MESGGQGRVRLLQQRRKRERGTERAHPPRAARARRSGGIGTTAPMPSRSYRRAPVRYRYLQRSSSGGLMPYVVDFVNVSTAGLESSPVAPALAGLRANEARYFKNKYDHVFTVEPARDDKVTLDWVHRILEERDIVISSRPLEVSAFQVENIRMAYVFYESGLS